jgi:hypothetical protein
MGFHLAGEDHRDHLEVRQEAVHPVKEEDHLEAFGEVSPLALLATLFVLHCLEPAVNLEALVTLAATLVSTTCTMLCHCVSPFQFDLRIKREWPKWVIPT